jgi:chromosomal replication initiation ATPase DnaA
MIDCNTGKKQTSKTCKKRSEKLKNRIISDLSKQKIEAFKQQYPQYILGIIDDKRYKEIQKDVKDMIPNWEK